MEENDFILEYKFLRGHLFSGGFSLSSVTGCNFITLSNPRPSSQARRTWRELHTAVNSDEDRSGPGWTWTAQAWLAQSWCREELVADEDLMDTVIKVLNIENSRPDKLNINSSKK